MSNSLTKSDKADELVITATFIETQWTKNKAANAIINL